MTLRPSPALLPLGLLAGVALLTTAACGASTDQGTTPAPTVTVTATETASAPTSSPPGVPASSEPRPSASTVDEGACGLSSLRVRYADDAGGAGAGSVAGTFTFTNTSSTSCTLRGFPGVSYVAGSKGTQIGAAATRTDDAVTTRTLKAGASVKAALRRAQPRNYPDCGETDVDGFRVYAPGSPGAFFVKFPTTGCRSTEAPLLQVGPVR